MWWLVGLLAALAAASNNNSRNAVVSDLQRPSASSSQTVTYRSRDGSEYFRFRFSQLRSGIRIHILDFPNPATGSCHVLHDQGGAYICWSGVIRTIEAAKAVAVMWAEATLVYQRTGRTF